MLQRFYQVVGVNFKQESDEIRVENLAILEMFKSLVTAQAAVHHFKKFRGFDNFLDFDVIDLETVDLKYRLPIIADIYQGNELRIYGHRLHLLSQVSRCDQVDRVISLAPDDVWIIDDIDRIVSLEPKDFWTEVLKTQGYLETIDEDEYDVPDGSGGVETRYRGSYRLLMEPNKEYILDI